MSSSSSELEKISTEIDNLLLQKQELQQRRTIQCLHQDLRKQLQLEHTDESDHHQQKIDQIDEKLKQLSEKIAELKKAFGDLFSAEDTEKDEVVIVELSEETDGGMNVFCVEPPKFPAPMVLDVENLSRCPCRTQCPECRQVVMTETIYSVSEVAWILCYSTAALGCVAGCCLIPFCFDRFKSITHKCPMCQTRIRTI